MYHTKQEKDIWFSRSIFAFILYFISDACWAAMLSGQFTKVRLFAVLFNFTNYVLMLFMACGVFMFIAISEKMAFCNDIRKRYLIYLPVIISTLFIIIAYLADPLYWIPGIYRRFPLIPCSDSNRVGHDLHSIPLSLGSFNFIHKKCKEFGVKGRKETVSPYRKYPDSGNGIRYDPGCGA